MSRALLLCTLLLTTWSYAAVPAHIRVRLFSIEQPSEIRITDKQGASTLLQGRSLGRPFRMAGPVTVERAKFDPVRLPYAVEVSARNGTLVIVTEIPIEDYVAAVLAGESANFQSDESLKAMAVAVRTYATYFFDRHKDEGFNSCDTTHCQDFRISAVTERFRSAARETRGEVVRYHGQPIPAYYHQDCGGIAEPGAPYLRHMTDEFCPLHGSAVWTAQLTAGDLRKALGVSEVRRIEITERTSSGRARLVRISGEQTKTLGAESFRLAVGRALGWDRILSDLYEVRQSADRFVFEGHGAGHGMGLCQNGAAVMGEMGHSYRQILTYYYPNTTIGL
jgi:stage II sporulation protein D